VAFDPSSPRGRKKRLVSRKNAMETCLGDCPWRRPPDVSGLRLNAGEDHFTPRFSDSVPEPPTCPSFSSLLVLAIDCEGSQLSSVHHRSREQRLESKSSIPMFIRNIQASTQVCAACLCNHLSQGWGIFSVDRPCSLPKQAGEIIVASSKPESGVAWQSEA